MSLAPNGKYLCDHPDCKSYVELSDPDDLKKPEKALSQRGWSVIKAEEETKHGCPAHTGKEFLPAILGTVN